MKTTREQRAELLRLLEKATPGKWRREAFTIQDEDGGWVADVVTDRTPEQDGANANLIISAHNALPSLLADLESLESLEAENRGLREAGEALVKNEMPECVECKALTVKSGDMCKCLNCGHERNWWAAICARMVTALSRRREE